MTFRDRLIATLRAIQPVLDEPGVLVLGSEVPNLLQPDAASTLVVSQDVGIAVSVSSHTGVKKRLADIQGLHPSLDEPSVWVPDRQELIEVNFIGMDPAISDTAESYVLEDATLPLLVFGALSFVQPAPPVQIDGVRVTLPKPAGLMLEKLLTDRSGEKGDRDLLVVLGLLLVATGDDLKELVSMVPRLSAESRHTVQANVSVLSLLPARPGMPDPEPQRARIRALALALRGGHAS